MNDILKNKIITIVFSFIFIAIFLINIFDSDKSISESERRKLKSFPDITFQNILNAQFMKDFDKYAVDQFIFRDEFRKLKTNTEFKLFLKKDNQNLFYLNNHIFKNLYPLNENEVNNAALKIKTIYDLFLKDNPNVYYSIIPDKNYYLSDYYLKMDYNKLLSIMNNHLKDISYIDIFDDLSLDSYYRTDLHWKQDQLNEVVKDITKSMGINTQYDYQEKTINNFKGAYYGQLGIKMPSDDITYLTNEIIDNAKVTIISKDNLEKKVYDLTKINSIDKYDIFLSGAEGLIEIKNDLALSDNELIVFRDSFGSSLVPLLIPYYKKITLIDLRYISSNIISNYVDFNNQDVLFIYSVNILNNGSILK